MTDNKLDAIIGNINKHICDDESRYIFSQRIMYSLSNDDYYLRALGERFKDNFLTNAQWKKYVEKLKEKESSGKMILYGAKGYGRMTIKFTPQIRWDYIVDRDTSIFEVNGIPVVQLETISDYVDIDLAYFIVPSMRYQEEMTDNLRSAGIKEDHIIDGSLIWKITEGRQYFDLEALKPDTSGEVFADLGACDGMSSVEFMKWCDNNGYCFCFEPDRKNADILKQNMAQKGFHENNHYSVVKKGAWSTSTELLFAESGSADSHLVSEEEKSDNIYRVPVTALDDELKGKKVTFIKMDIEGAELEALHGAEEIIRNQRPKLAICVYHKPEDIWAIPTYILSLQKDYKLFLRHYSFGATETVLYAI